jgi:hypothetical protein
MITTALTQKTINVLTGAVTGTSNSLNTSYIQWGTGSSPALATDETVSNPIEGRFPLTVKTITTTISGDTANFIATVTSTGTNSITNFGLFDVSTSAPVGYLTYQLNPTDTSITISGYSNFPNVFPFYVQIASEVMTVTSGNGSNLFYVTRHTNNSPISVSGYAIGTQIVGGNGTSNGNMILKSSFPALVINDGDSLTFNISIQFL